MTTPPLLPWQAQLGDVVMGPGTPYEWLEDLDGFDELASIRSGDEPRPAGHGDYTGTDYADGRTLSFSLEVAADEGVGFDEALAALARVLVPNPGPDTVPFWFRLPGLGTRRADVKVRRRRTTIDRAYEAGLAVVDVQLRAPDPLLYGDTITTPAAAFPELSGGLEFDLFTDGAGTATGYLEFGAQSSTGRLLLTNPGTADTWPVFDVAGPIPDQGFEIIRTDTGDRLRYVGALAATSTLRIDTSTGTVILDGTADRGGRLVYRDWFSVPAGAQCEILFTPLGTLTAATLVATYAPAYW